MVPVMFKPLIKVCDNPLEGNNHILEYVGKQGKRYSRASNTSGRIEIPVLEFLNGLPLTNLTLAYCHGLQPSMIRVSDGEVTTDSQPRRITIIVRADNTIESIGMAIDCLYANGATVQEHLLKLKAERK